MQGDFGRSEEQQSHPWCTPALAVSGRSKAQQSWMCWCRLGCKVGFWERERKDVEDADEVTECDEQVCVLVRHAVAGPCDGWVRVRVKSSATMGEVKAALADALGRPDVVRHGRFVRRAGSAALSSIGDADKLGARRALCLVGVTDLRAAVGGGGPAAPEEAPLKRLTLMEALRMQRDLLERFGRPGFQRRLREFWGKLEHEGAEKFEAERQKLLLAALINVLPCCGIEASQRGVLHMMDQFSRPERPSDSLSASQSSILDRILLGPPGDGQPDGPALALPPLPARGPRTPALVEVLVRGHGGGGSGGEVRVRVPEGGTMGDVKAALARELGDARVLSQGRLVRRLHEALVAYADEDPIGIRRRLLFLGPGLGPGRAAAPEPRPAAPLTATGARELLRQLCAAVGALAFQAALSDARQLVAATEREPDRARAALRSLTAALVAAACQRSLQGFGLGGGEWGHCQVLSAVFPHRHDAEVRCLAHQVEWQLGVELGTWFGFEECAGTGPVFEMGDGWLAEGDDLFAERMSPEDARTRLLGMSECEAFCYEGSPEEESTPRMIYFKAKWRPRHGGRRSGWRTCRLLGGPRGGLAGPALSRREAGRLLEDISRRCSEPAFQEEVRSLEARSPGRPADATRGEAFHVLHAQLRGVAWAFGFGADPAGVRRMRQSLQEHLREEPIAAAARGVDVRLLRSLLGAWFSGGAAPARAEGPAAAGAAEAEARRRARSATRRVRVRHALSGAEAVVHVPGAATMLEVKGALAQQLGRAEILRSTRLVRAHRGAAMVAYEDGEPLGGRTRLLALGPDLARSGSPARGGSAEGPRDSGGARGQCAAGGALGKRRRLPPRAGAEGEASLGSALPREQGGLTLERAHELLGRMRATCEDPEFQGQLMQLFRQQRGDRFNTRGIGFLFAEACRPHVIGAGFPDDGQGFGQMFRAVRLLGSDPTVVRETARRSNTCCGCRWARGSGSRGGRAPRSWGSPGRGGWRRPSTAGAVGPRCWRSCGRPPPRTSSGAPRPRPARGARRCRGRCAPGTGWAATGSWIPRS
ncbi:unnamed protein product [Prorocentrum cordatum]|uniref:Ubiquitin-like domain-containing protein n=1 Tax=Prorocentrum cordatum TaxID=2364126 RepID=A0ABN9SYW2_9DINO|nr:unnamed protein product [Polarella glacialis]